MALEPAKLSDFALAGSLGTGTTAKVYDAIHRASGRAVAIKLMEQGAPSNDAESRERFAREALALAGLDSPHVGKILGYGFERGQPFLVLERLYGETLGAKLRRDGPVVPHVAFKWIEQLLLGVRDCHDANVIHRDIKPSNLFLHQQGFDEVAKLIDFGVARQREIGRAATATRESTADGDLTGPNHVIGSMAYMAPEQLQNPKGVGFPADLYAIGVVVYRTLTGRLPFVSRSPEAVLRMKVEQTPPAISALGGAALQIPLLDTFVWTALRRAPESRFRSAREMLDHWRIVMAALDEDVTDIMGGVGRVDESYAGPRPRPGSAADAAEAEAAQGWEEIRAADEDRTLRQFHLPLPSGRGSVVPPRTRPREQSESPSPSPSVHQSQTTLSRVNGDALSSDRTIRDPAPRGAAEDDAREAAPASEPADVTVVPREPERDPERGREEEEVPTKSHPNLRELVQRELDLYRGRARDSKG